MKPVECNDILRIIADDLRDVGGDLQRGASDFTLQSLEDRAQRLFGIPLPPEYTYLLRITDGLSWGGVAIYGTSESPILGFPDRLISGFVESNIGFRNSSLLFESYLIFGSDGDCLLSYNIECNSYEIITVFMTRLGKFNDFFGMVCHVLKKQM